MKFSCNQQLLSKALNTVSKAVTTRTTIPILKGILLEVNQDGMLKLAASDLDLSIEKKLPVAVWDEGAIVVSARLFSDIIRKLPNEEIEIEEENGSVTIRCLSSEFTIVGQAAEEFPNVGIIKEEDKRKMNRDIFREMIKKTAFSASIEESKGIIVGILIEMEEDGITMVALDGFRMAVAREDIKNAEKRKIIIAARILSELYKILTEEESAEEIDLILDEKKAVILLADTRVVLRIMEGEFIKYKEILPKESQCTVIVNKGELADSLERASLLAKEGKNNLIKCAIFRDKIIITSRSEEGNVKEEVFVQKEGNDLEIGFNAKYILDVLKAIHEEEVKMEFNTSVSPCLIRPLEGNAYEYLVLPVRISAGF
ncbi:MAG: DNA polymerase III subunit beta [Firmicutes bacterium HGW-Firmicutes-11]|jgi:DNA polymerase-3 subunit beta|nr:MAG: DNA polymerase III subunit beta [Firmicutes bacterium HGW-Firmicutes-11]